jgi:hypothetical protein
MPPKGKSRKVAAKNAAATRELIALPNDKRYVRRDPEGVFQQSDDVGRALSEDRHKKAKTVVKPGQGSRGTTQEELAFSQCGFHNSPIW